MTAANRPPNPGSPEAVKRGCICQEPPHGNAPTSPSHLRRFRVAMGCVLHAAPWSSRRAWTIEEVEARKADHTWL